MKSSHIGEKPPATLLFWTLTDEVIEKPDVLERQFHEIQQSGFGGVAAFVRCSRYNWYDEPARKAYVRIGRLCKRYHMQNWVGPDPRFVSRLLIPPTGGLEVLLFGDRARADVFPNFGAVVDGRFSVRCYIAPRHVHTLQEVAIEYYPQGIERIYAVRMRDEGRIPAQVVDVTGHGHFFHNARGQYVEAFGQLPKRFMAGEWKVLPFFRARTNHVDFADTSQMGHYISMLNDLKNEQCHADGVMWDEPGFTCTYGTLPYSQAIREEYKRSAHEDVQDNLWKLALDAEDGSHAWVRIEYYQAIQRLLNDANARFTKYVKRLWGKATVSGIHDTWHWESADMCDMNHGSLDLWQAAKSKTGGFVDLGGIDKLRDPASPWNAHLAAMSVICASLGKKSPGGYAYNNLWTVGDDDGEGWQATVMDHCVNTMALFGTRWLAHCYGPVGTIGEEQSFLGSPQMPGYPNHSTWRYYPVWNKRLDDHLETVEHNLPLSSVLVVYPIDELYTLAGPAADRVAGLLFELILAMLDQHYQVDVLSASAYNAGHLSRADYVTGKRRYKGVFRFLSLFNSLPDSPGARRSGGFRAAGKNPIPAVVEQSVFGVFHPFANVDLSTFRNVSEQAPVIVLDEFLAEGGEKAGKGFIRAALTWLAEIPGIRPVDAPDRSWATITELEQGTIVTLAPSRHGYRYCGKVAFEGREVELSEERAGLTRILFPLKGEPRILQNGPDFSI